MIYVIGDGINDEYVYGSYTKISPETPIPIFKEERVEKKLGGAWNVIANLTALGANPYFDCGCSSTKTRYVVDNRIVFRSDNETYEINDFTDYNPIGINWLVISDYNKGHLHHTGAIINNFKKAGVKIIVDPKKKIHNYVGADIIKLNQKEFYEYTGHTDFDNCELIRRNFNIGAIVITLGGDGVYISSKKFTGKIPGERREVADVTGAGDVFLAAMSYYLDRGVSLKEACTRANTLASISVTKMGTYVLQPEDLKEVTVVFTNGCFDILHKGHIEYLRESKKLGGKLIVGLNSDKSVKRLKGACRPINNQYDRRAVLQSIGCVDQVIIFDEDTPYDLIKDVTPDIITKGGDYTPDMVIGNDLAKVVIISYVEGYSTTKILEKT
jgi:D-beta-D-heptose 7-phosphate kinase/D-beta-D-heptose 1-phosphate adenosyltransferase